MSLFTLPVTVLELEQLQLLLSHQLLQGEAILGTPYVDAQWSGVAQDFGTNVATGANKDTGFSYRAPPDNALAVGPDGIVTVENSAIMAFNSKGSIILDSSLPDFFSSLPQRWTTFADPRAVYDQVHGHYIVVADAFNIADTSKIDEQHVLFDGQNSILVAISKDSDPSHGWYYQVVNTSYMIGGGQTIADYPMIAVDNSNILVSTVQIPAPPSEDVEDMIEEYQGGDALTVVKDVFANGGLGTGGHSATQVELVNPAQAADIGIIQPAAYPTGGDFLISRAFDGTVLYYSYSKDSYSKIGVAEQTIDLGNIDATTDYLESAYPHLVPQRGTTVNLDGGNERIVSTALANGHLYAVFEVTPLASDVATVHWVDIDVHDPTKPVLTDQGNISLPGAATFNPSIAVDGNGDLLINFTASSGSITPTDYYTVRPNGSAYFSNPIAYQASHASYIAHIADDPNIARWGDYSSAVADPSASNAFWISNEYVIDPQHWGTVIAHVVVPLSVLGGLCHEAPLHW
jgi:hypothetical protein